MAWNVVGTVVRQGTALGMTIIVARLLLPTDYAIGGLALSILNFFAALTAQGFAQVLVQRPALSDLSCHSVFWLMVLGGVALGGGMIAVAPGLAKFYGQPAFISMMWLLTFVIVVSMLGAVPNALLQRAMRFREINLISMVGGVLSGGVGIVLAFAGYGYWALVTPVVGTLICRSVGALWLSGYRPAWAFSWHEFKAVSPFGLWLSGANINRYFADNADYLLLGKLWEATLFGYYYFAFERARQPFNLIMAQVSTVAFPAFSSIQHDTARLKQAFLRGTHAMCLVMFPLHVLLVILADPLIPFLFGEQWRPAMALLQLFGVFGLLKAYASFVPTVLLAINRPHANLAFSTFRLIFTLPTLLYLGFIQADTLTVGIILVCIWSLQLPFFVAYLCRHIQLRFSELWGMSKRLLGATIVMGIGLVISRRFAMDQAWQSWLTLLFSGSIGSLLYVTLAWRDIRQCLQMLHWEKRINALLPRFLRGSS